MIGAVAVLWSAMVQLWNYLLSNIMLSVGMLLILLHLLMIFIDKIKKLLK